MSLSVRCRELLDDVLRLQRTGQLRDAVRSCRALNREFPGFALGWAAAGALATDLGSGARALTFIERACDLEPQEPRWQWQRGHALQATWDRTEACHIAQTAAPPVDSGAAGLASAALLCERCGEWQRAESLRQLAVAAGDVSPSEYFSLAKLLQILGRPAEAAAAARTGLARDDTRDDGHWLLSCLERQRVDSNRIASLLERLSTDPQAQQPYLHFALAKEYEDCDQLERALEHLLQAHGTSANSIQDSASAMADAVRESTSALLPDAVAGTSSGPRPVIVLGEAGSGGGRILRMLGAHGDLAPIVVPGTFGALASTLAQRAAQRRLEPLERVAHWQNIDLAALASLYLGDAQARVAHPTGRWVDALSDGHYYCGLLAAALPGALFVDVGLDHEAACGERLRNPPGVGSNALQIIAGIQTMREQLLKHWHGLLGDRMLRADGQALIAGNEAAWVELLGFCGLEWQEGCTRPPARSGVPGIFRAERVPISAWQGLPALKAAFAATPDS